MEFLKALNEGSHAEVVQLIAGIKIVSFLASDMASKTMPDMVSIN